MTERPPVQKLAAILMADVVGFSRMMGANEIGTLAALTQHRRAFIDPMIASFRGRIVKTTGDGFLLEFASAVDAVRCAVAMQQGLAKRNGDIDDNQRVVFRMGVNIGDVIVQAGDIFGNGVNVAARLEPFAEPGGLAISRSTFEQVRDRVTYPFDDRGDVEVKNIARPIGVLTLSATALAALPEEKPEPIAVVPLRRRSVLLASLAALSIGIAGAIVWMMHSPTQPPAQSLTDQLTSTLAAALPALPADEVTRVVRDFIEGTAHRSLAVAPRSGDHRWTADWPTSDVANEKALERCQMTYGEPCAIIAYDYVVIPPDAGGHWVTRDVASVRYSGPFAIDKIPGMRPGLLQRPDVSGYAAATGAKAIAIHPQGVFSVVTNAASKSDAEEQALKKCNEDPSRKNTPTRCLLYASGNQVILPLRKTKPQAK